MWSSALVSSLHMMGLALTLGAIFMRARYLRKGTLRQVFLADNAWGISALVMLGSGVARAFGGLEKGSDYYLRSPAFWIKMTCLGLILVLEAWPMVTLIKWRARADGPPETSKMRVFAMISDVQTLLALIMIVAASFMARGH